MPKLLKTLVCSDDALSAAKLSPTDCDKGHSVSNCAVSALNIRIHLWLSSFALISCSSVGVIDFYFFPIRQPCII